MVDISKISSCININVWNFNFPIGFYSNLHSLWTPQNMTLTPFTTKLKTLGPTRKYIYNSTKFHEILSCSSWDLPWTSSWSAERKEKEKEEKEKENNNNKKRSKNNKSPKLCLGDLIIIIIIIIIRNGAKTISLPNFVWET